MFRYQRITMIIVSIIFSVLFLLPVSAQGLKESAKNLGQVVTNAGYSDSRSNIGAMIGQGIKVALTMVGVIFLVLMVYAGFLWMTARGEETQVQKAQKIITSSVIGMIIVVSAYAITVLVMKQLITLH